MRTCIAPMKKNLFDFLFFNNAYKALRSISYIVESRYECALLYSAMLSILEMLKVRKSIFTLDLITLENAISNNFKCYISDIDFLKEIELIQYKLLTFLSSRQTTERYFGTTFSVKIPVALINHVSYKGVRIRIVIKDKRLLNELDTTLPSWALQLLKHGPTNAN